MAIHRILTFTLCFLSMSVFAGAPKYSVTTASDLTFCGAVPTAYQTMDDFCIEETDVKGFEKNVTKNLIITPPANFEFNNNGGVLNVNGASPSVNFTTGGDINTITVNSFASSSIDLQVTTFNSQSTLEWICFSGIEIRAAATAVAGDQGDVMRTGGTFKIDGSADNPGDGAPNTAESFGNVLYSTDMSYTSSTTTQSNTSNVAPGRINAQIIGIEVVVADACNPFSVTQFDFDTDGGNGTGSDNEATNLDDARVFYTGTDINFATTTQFGSDLGSVPNGSFSITGSQQLQEGTNYFWLVYDLAPGAASGDLLDAVCTSITMDGGVGAKTPTVSSPGPVGSRTIAALYSRNGGGNWDNGNTWSTTSHSGAACACTPSATTDVIIGDNDVVTLNANGNAQNLVIATTGVLTGGAFTLDVAEDLQVSGTGYFSGFTKQITVNGNALFAGTGASSTAHKCVFIRNLSILDNASLTLTGAQDCNIGGNLIVDGTLAHNESGTKKIKLDANPADISGTGTISSASATADHKLELKDAVNVLAGSNLTIDCIVGIDAGPITNSGNIEFNYDVDEQMNAPTFTNATGGSVKFGGVLFATGGVLRAHATGNSVEYDGAAQVVYTPFSSYHNLLLTGSGAKTTTANITVDNDLTISGTANLDPGTTNYTLTGDLINNGLMTQGTGSSTFTFDGTTAISGSGTSNFHGVTITGSLTPAASSTINVSGPFDNSGTFTHNSGTIDFNGAAQLVQNAGGSVFNNLTFSGSGAKTTGHDLDINGVMTTSGTASFSPGTNNVNLAGNLVNNGTVSTGTGASTFTFDGTTVMSGSGTVGMNIVSITGSLDASLTCFMNGNVTISGTGTMTNTANTNITMGAGFTNNNVFSSGTGTYNFTGAGGIIDDASGEMTFEGILDVDAAIVVNCDLDINDDLTGTGGFSIPSGGTVFVFDDLTLTSLNATANSPTTVVYDGSGDQIGKVTPYYNLLVNNTAPEDTKVAFGGSISVSNDMTINDGHVALEVESYQLTGAGSLTVANGGILELATTSTGALVLPELTGTRTFGATSKLKLDRAGAQRLKTGTYGHVQLLGSGTKTVKDGNVIIQGDLSIEGTAALSAHPTENNTITIGGNWNNVSAVADPFLEQTAEVIFNGSGAQSITCSGAGTETFYDLTIANGGNTVSMNNDATVANQLDFTTSGYLDVGTSSLTILNWDDGDIPTLGFDRFVLVGSGGSFGATNVGMNETVNLPMGLTTGSTNFARMDVKNTDGSNRNFVVTLCDYVNNLGTCSGGIEYTTDIIDYYWDVTSASTGADVTVYWDTSKELPGFDRNSMRLSHHTGGAWVYLGDEASASLVSGSIYKVTATTTGFSGVGGGDFMGPLPIELSWFTAKLSDNGVLLEWETESEIDNDFFTIEKSMDGENWEEIDIIKGAGNSSEINYYSSLDLNPFIGENFYRIKQTDFNKEFSYSKIALVWIENKQSNAGINLYPNPNSGLFVNLEFNQFGDQEDILVIVEDIFGKQFYEKVVMLNGNDNYIEVIDFENILPPGTYLITASSKNRLFNKKMVVR